VAITLQRPIHSVSRQSIRSTVHVINSDDRIREAIAQTLQAFDVSVIRFEKTQDFLAEVSADRGGCLILDTHMLGVDGLDFQQHLTALGYKLPVIFVTSFVSIPVTVKAMKAGAVDFLTKPFKDEDILNAVYSGLRQDAIRQSRDAENESLMTIATNLTSRERQVMAGVVKGLMNKQIAHQLALTEITIKLHRASLMRKMQARTVPDLVRKAELISTMDYVGFPPEDYAPNNRFGAVAI
jgi:FixJ family two-component response regulator